MYRVAATALVALSLAACSGGQSTNESAAATGDVSLTNASPEEVAAQAKAAGGGTKLQAGNWEIKVEPISVDAPNVPAAAREQMTASMKKATNTITNCITEEQANQPGADVFTGGAQGQCKYDKFSMSGGKINSSLSCPGQGGMGASTITMKGDVKPTEFSIESTMKMTAPGTGEMTVVSKTSGRRIGECKA